MTARRRRKGGGGKLLGGLLLFLLGAGAGALVLRQVQKRETAGPSSRGTEPAPAPRVVESGPSPTPAPPRTPRPTPKAVPSDFEAARESGKGVLAIVLDDLGNADGSLAHLESFEGPLALAVLPDAPRAREAAALAKRKGWDLLVHLPMEPVSGKEEPGSIGTSDDDAAIAKRVEAALGKVPGAIGLNNHQGSKATADARVIRAVLTVVRDRGLLFLDSRTSASTVAASEARRLGISTVSRDVFLDDARTEALTEGGTEVALEGAWKRALELAGKKGTCILVGHPHRETLDFLAAHLPAIGERGLHRVRLSELAD